MYMRFVQLKIRPERINDFENLYERRITPALHETKGCLFAALMTRHAQTEECISMTLWEDPEDAARYEQSGLYESLLMEADSMISDSSEWKIRLSDDLKLEYGPVREDPVITTSLVESSSSDEAPTDVDAPETYLRIVSARLRPGQFEAAADVYKRKIIPVLSKVAGCRYAYLTRSLRETDIALSVTLWDSEEHAQAYEASGQFAQMTRLVEPMFSELLQWKMALSPTKRDRTTTSDDISIKGYHVVTSDSFSTVHPDA